MDANKIMYKTSILRKNYPTTVNSQQYSLVYCDNSGSRDIIRLREKK